MTATNSPDLNEFIGALQQNITFLSTKGPLSVLDLVSLKTAELRNMWRELYKNKPLTEDPWARNETGNGVVDTQLRVLEVIINKKIADEAAAAAAAKLRQVNKLRRDVAATLAQQKLQEELQNSFTGLTAEELLAISAADD